MEFFRAKIKIFKKTNPKHQVHTLKKPFTLFLILSHLNAFVLGVGGMGNVYAANQVVDTLRLGLPYTAPPSCEVPMTFELLSIAVSSDANASPVEFGIDVSHLSNISAGSIKLIVTEKGC
jgi:hypothetical protein